MANFNAVLCSVVVLLAVCSTHAAVGGTEGYLVTVYRHPPGRFNCSLIAVAPASGQVRRIANATHLCNDGNPAKTAPAKTASGQLLGSPTFFFTTARTPCSVHAINPTTGDSKPIAMLEADWTIVDLSVAGDLVVVTTTDSVYTMNTSTGTSLTKAVDISSIQLSGLSQAVLAYPMLYTVLTQSPGIVPVDLKTGSIGAQVKVDLQALVDTQYWANQGSIVILASYELYSVDPTTGVSTHIIQIPDGIGYPSISTLSGDVFYFSDFQESYSVSLTANSIISKYPFDGYFCQGNFRYIVM